MGYLGSGGDASGGEAVVVRPARVGWRVFRSPAVLAVVLMHVACNQLWTTFAATVFTFYDEILSCSTLQTGRWLAFPPLVQLVGNFVVAYLESCLIAAKVSTLTIRKLMTAGGALISALALVLFGRCGSPQLATLWYCVALAGTCLHGSGIICRHILYVCVCVCVFIYYIYGSTISRAR